MVMSLAPGEMAGHYRVIARFGSRGIEAFKAHDPGLGANVAIKIFRPNTSTTPTAGSALKRKLKLPHR